jgi:hypothetical protein
VGTFSTSQVLFACGLDSVVDALAVGAMTSPEGVAPFHRAAVFDLVERAIGTPLRNTVQN